MYVVVLSNIKSSGQVLQKQMFMMFYYQIKNIYVLSSQTCGKLYKKK